MSQEFHNEIAIYYLGGTLFVIVLIAAIVFYVFLHQKKVNFFRLQLQKEEIKKQEAIFSALQEGEERERNRIAEELHDGISAKLAGLNMNLDYLRAKINNKDSETLIEKTFVGISEIINELRDISHNLQPLLLNEKNLQFSLSNYIDQLNSKNECHYDLYFESSIEAIKKPLKLHCYRIITELLYNIHKHANSRIASVQMILDDNNLELIIEDNGKGFKIRENDSKGIGLTNIQNRVSINNGSMNIDSSDDGTTIIIVLPLN